MPAWKLLLLGLYYQTTLPLRWWSGRRASAAGRAPLVVLCYHRIADDDATPWTASHPAFVRQIGWLRRHFEMISLHEVQRRIRDGDSRRPAVSITFDDGYWDNCRRAIPLLLAEKIPCTYFVTARNVLQGLPFEHDLAVGRRLAPNTLEQLRAMARAGVEIGAHAYNHFDLARIDDTAHLWRELSAARECLRTAVGAPVDWFAFPFGQHANLSGRAFDLAAEAGYRGACSAYGGVNLPGDDAFHLQRIVVDGATLRLKNWVTGDPRKARTPRFAWSPAAEGAPEGPAAGSITELPMQPGIGVPLCYDDVR